MLNLLNARLPFRGKPIAIEIVGHRHHRFDPGGAVRRHIRLPRGHQRLKRVGRELHIRIDEHDMRRLGHHRLLHQVLPHLRQHRALGRDDSHPLALRSVVVASRMAKHQGDRPSRFRPPGSHRGDADRDIKMVELFHPKAPPRRKSNPRLRIAMVKGRTFSKGTTRPTYPDGPSGVITVS